MFQSILDKFQAKEDVMNVYASMKDGDKLLIRDSQFTEGDKPIKMKVCIIISSEADKLTSYSICIY